MRHRPRRPPPPPCPTTKNSKPKRTARKPAPPAPPENEAVMSSHLIRGRQLSRDTEHRKALRRNLCQSLFEHGKIRTTLPKAKEVKAMAEKLITLARRNTLTSRRRVISIMQDRRLVDENQDFIEEGPTRTVVQKLFNDIAPNFSDRPGGYMRIIKLS